MFHNSALVMNKQANKKKKPTGFHLQVVQRERTCITLPFFDYSAFEDVNSDMRDISAEN